VLFYEERGAVERCYGEGRVDRKYRKGEKGAGIPTARIISMDDGWVAMIASH